MTWESASCNPRSKLSQKCVKIPLSLEGWNALMLMMLMKCSAGGHLSEGDGMLMMLMKCSAGGHLSEGAQGMARALLHKRCMIQCITSRGLEVRTICPDFICVLRARLITREL